jgi:uncharacterized damage-inducible protein DinB
MTHGDLTTLLDFHYWARDRVLAAVSALTGEQYVRPLGSSFSSVRDTLVHLLSAEVNWYKRWQGVAPSRMLDPAEYPDVATLTNAWRAQETEMRSYLASLDDDGVARVLDYRALNGTPYRSAISEMFQHVVNHGTYHRGQVQTMLRQLGANPSKSLDFITYSRETRPR